MKRKLEPGQVWAGKCLSSYEPELWFIYVLLSADEEDGVLWWSAAEYMRGKYGAAVHKFSREEIHNGKLEYVGHVIDFVKDSSLTLAGAV